jgi:hypothetical protein
MSGSVILPLYLTNAYLVGIALWLATGGLAMVGLLKLRRAWRGNPRRLRCVNLGLSCWLFAGCITLLELYLAFFYDSSDSFNQTHVSKRWFHRQVVNNDEGFRDDHPFDQRVPAGVQRICFLGDSFTFGHGINDVRNRFSDRVAAELEQARPGKFAVNNLGQPGWNPVMNYGLMKNLVEKEFDVHTIVHTFCLNDIEAFEDRSGRYYRELGRHYSDAFLVKYTYTCNLAYYRLLQLRQPELRNYYNFVRDSYDGQAWDRMQDLLREMHQFARSNKIDLRMVIFPFVHNLGPNYPYEEAHRKLVEFCEAENTPVLDLLPVLNPHANEGLTVSAFDAHPNERAHALAADAIRRQLLSDLFQPDTK